MPLTITIPGWDGFDEKTGRFCTMKAQTVELEHSLLSIAKWESKWHKPYLSMEAKTEEESLDYIRCMCLTRNVDPTVFRALTRENVKAISDYIADPMTATTFNRKDKRRSREIITNELVYFWMANFSIPFDPCQKWHFNRLMTLIEIAAIKNEPPKKMGTRDILKQNAMLNAQRRAKLGTRG